jgi:hypothetical protein
MRDFVSLRGQGMGLVERKGVVEWGGLFLAQAHRPLTLTWEMKIIINASTGHTKREEGMGNQAKEGTNWKGLYLSKGRISLDEAVRGQKCCNAVKKAFVKFC